MSKTIKTSLGARSVNAPKDTAKIIKRWREDRKHSKSEFAAMLGLKPNTYHYIESGRLSPSFQAVTILRQLGFDINELHDIG